MKVTRAALPLLPLCQRVLPSRLTGLSVALLKATALELAILAGHLLLYPSGIAPERRAATTPDPTVPPEAVTAHLPVEPKPPVVLLHGFIDNRSVFVLLRRSLVQHGSTADRVAQLLPADLRHPHRGGAARPTHRGDVPAARANRGWTSSGTAWAA